MSRAFANLDGLLRLSRADGIDIRPALLRVITDLFVQEATHTREEIQQYAELSLRLLPVVDPQTRSAVVAKLTACAGTPAWLLQEIRRLPTAGNARRSDPSIDTVAQAIAAQSPAGPGTKPAAVTFSQVHGGAAPEAGEPIGEQFLRAAPPERQALLLHLQETQPRGVDFARLRNRLATIERLRAAAETRHQREFARELQHAFDLSNRIAGEIAYDDWGEPLLVIARAADMPEDVFLRILLLLNPAIGESVERVFSLYRLYGRVDLAAATPILASWQEESRGRGKPRYQSLHAPDGAAVRPGTRDAVKTATELQREVAARPATPLRRQGTT